MAQSDGHRLITYSIIVILMAVAATGWYFYSGEVDKNRATASETQTQLVDTRKQLSTLQTKFERLQKDHQEFISQSEHSTTEQQKQINELQQALDVSQSEKTSLEATISRLDAELEGIQSEKRATDASFEEKIERLVDENRQLNERLGHEMATGQNLMIELERINTEKSDIQSRLEEKINSAKLTTEELEAELDRRKAAQASLLNQVETFNDEKSQLLSKLEQEQQSKKQIADLKKRLEDELNETRVEITQLKNQMTVIKLTDDVLFESGSAEIKAQGRKVLSIIAESLNEYPDRAISVEGHTDNIPIRNISFSSNWELSVARSLSAVNYFQQQSLVSPGRLQVVGYGEHHPVASNETAAGRRMNRRIEIKLLPPGLEH